MKPIPLITIGISCFNAEKTIAQAIESARSQDWPNLEIIVVDDCSSDGSARVVRKIAKRDKRIRFRKRKRNGGLAIVRNDTIRLAKGEYIAFFDDDDQSRPSRLTKQYERLSAFEAEHPGSPALCYCNLRPMKGGRQQAPGYGVVMGYKAIGRRPPEPHGSMIADYFFLRIAKKNHVFGAAAGAATFAATRTLREFGFDPELRRAQDWDLSIRIGFAGGYCISVDEELVDYRLKERVDKTGTAALDYELALVEKHKDYLKSAGNHLAAVCHAHARFHRTRNLLKMLFYLSLACALSPRVLAATVKAALKLPTYRH